MIDMTKEQRSELRELNKLKRALTREEDAAARQRGKAFDGAEKALRRELAALEKMGRKSHRTFEAAKKALNRESAVLHAAFTKRGRAIAERIAIIEGRLA